MKQAPSSLLSDKAMKQVMDDLVRDFMAATEKSRSDPFYEQFCAESRAHWNALPWYVKIWRRSRIKEACWRVKVAFDILRRGDLSKWLGD